MKTAQYFRKLAQQVSITAVFMLVVIAIGCAKKEAATAQQGEKTDNSTERFWHVKAITPEGAFLDVKAFDAFGSSYDVKAIERNGQTNLMDIKAFVKGKILPVKILVNKDKYTPVKAISKDGTVFNIRAISPNGDLLRINGVRRSGTIIHVKAVTKNGEEYGVKAISPTGQLNDVKGIKMREEALEYVLYNAEIYAHVKALTQTGDIGNNFLWHIVAIHPDGYTLAVNAMDSKGKLYEVKAILDQGHRYILNIKAFKDDGEKLPVKMLMGDEAYKPMAAIDRNGEIYDIIITSKDGDRLDVKGTNRVNNIVDIKVLNEDGVMYAVKALSPKGDLNDVKGIKFLKQDIEMQIHGIDIHAHVKALPQAK